MQYSISPSINMKIQIKNKGGNLLFQMTIHIILVVLIFGMFFASATQRVNSRDVKQQVFEKQLALMIDSAEQGMIFKIPKVNRNGVVNSIEIRDGRIFAYISGLSVSKGYPYFTKYNLELNSDVDYFYIKVI